MTAARTAPRARLLDWFTLAVLCLASQGCLVRSPRAELERLEVERGTPWAVTVFRTLPGPTDRPLSELRETLSYWSSHGSRGEPRSSGVLVAEPPDLYSRLLAAIEGGADRVTLKAYRYDSIGFDEVTLVDYFDEKDALVGHDHVAFPELADPPGGQEMVGYFSMSWWEYPQLLLDLPVYLAIGLKELAGEVAKSPLSLVSSGWIGPIAEGRSPLCAVSLERSGGAMVEDWRNGVSAFAWRFRARSRHTPIDLLHDLLAAIPVAGSLFEYSSPPPDSARTADTGWIAISPGIHLGGDQEQYVTAWRRAVERVKPNVPVVVAPYRYGSAFDTLWSVLNISHGAGYDLASRLLFDEGVAEGDTLELAAFSGGAQRAVAATRALRIASVTVRRLVGIAGPVAGSSCAVESTLLLDEACCDDIAVLASRALDFLFFFIPSNVRRMAVPGAGEHRLPYFPDGATRQPHLGYSKRFEESLGSSSTNH